MRASLRQQGMRVSASSRTRDLLDQAERQCPDVVVLEEGLETMGCEVLVRLVRQRSPGARIILILPEVPRVDPESLRHLDLFRYLRPPVSGADLLDAIRGALREGPRTDAKRGAPVIMCVDDDRRFLKCLVRILRQGGYTVTAYDDPEQAIEAVPLVNPSLVFLDVLMPGMNGLDMASELRQDYGDTLPLVLLSARGSDAEISEGYRSGALYYVTKPCDPADLIKIADTLVGNTPVARDVPEGKGHDQS